MEQRDFLKLQIEQLGRVLGQIFNEFLGLKSQGNDKEAIEITNESLKRELDLDIDQIIGRDTSELKEYLEQRKITGENLMPLADYLIAMAEIKMPTHQPQAVAKYQSVLQLYEIMDTTMDSYSLDRFEKEEQIKAIIQASLPKQN